MRGLRAAAWDFIRCVEPELCSDGIAPPPWSIALLAPDSGGCSAESRQCPWFHRVREVGAVVSQVPGLVFRQWRMEPVVSQFQALIGTGPWHRDARGGRGCRRLPVGASWPAKPTNSPEGISGKHVLDCTPRDWIPSFLRTHVGQWRVCPMIGTCPGGQQCARIPTASRLARSCQFRLCADVSASVPSRTPRRLGI